MKNKAKDNCQCFDVADLVSATVKHFKIHVEIKIHLTWLSFVQVTEPFNHESQSPSESYILEMIPAVYEMFREKFWYFFHAFSSVIVLGK